MKHYYIEIKWAVYYVMMVLVWMLGERLLGLHDQYIHRHAQFTWLIIIPGTLIYYLALKEKKKWYYLRRMNFMEGFISGLVLTALITLFSPISQYIVSKWITPHYFEHAIQLATEKKILSLTAAKEYFSLMNYIKLGIMGALITGIFTSVIMALLLATRKSSQSDTWPPPPKTIPGQP